MAKVKIILEKGESPSDADAMLLKALQLHSTGDVHIDESFDDPAMIDAAAHLERIHKQIYSEMLEEINDVIDAEY